MRIRLLYFSLFTIHFSLFTLCNAQFNTYHPFPDSNAWWSEEEEGLTNCPMMPPFVEYYDYFIRTDTIINGNTYHTIYTSGGYGFSSCGGLIWSDYCNYMGSIREDSLKHIYFNSKSTNYKDTLLYDFNLKVGDTLPASYNNNPSSKNYVKSIDSVLIGTKYRKQFIVTDSNNSYWKDSIIEGIGSNQGLLEPIYPGFEYFTYLLCFKQNDTTVYPYLNDSCQEFILGVHNIQQEKITFTVYPNPSIGIFTMQSSVVNGHPDSYRESIEVYNVLGEKVYSQFNIQNPTFSIDLIGQPSGVYFYRVVGENGELIGDGKLVLQ